MTLCHEGRISIFCFSTSLFTILLQIINLFWEFLPHSCWLQIVSFLLYFVVVTAVFRIIYKDRNYQIAIRAIFLACILSLSFTVFLSCPENWRAFGIYGGLMSIFHYSEFLAIAYSNPKTLTPDSFILNHSIHYALAAIASWIEFIVETYFFPDVKTFKFMWTIGFILCVSGEILRKVSMITANTNFSHVVQFEHNHGHVLVTNGVYSYMRHPSYVGWFWWSIGTQIILTNPICFVIYAIASWKFFHDRIFMEEITLLNFFGDEYYKYQQKVGTGLPFIRGFKVDL